MLAAQRLSRLAESSSADSGQADKYDLSVCSLARGKTKIKVIAAAMLQLARRQPVQIL